MALWTRQVFVSLFFGIVAGEFILLQGDILALFPQSMDRMLSQFAEGWKIKTLFFAILVGSIIRLLSQSGGVEAFIAYVEKKGIRSKKEALLMGYFTGLLIFLESSITALIVGTLIKPLSRTYGISREKLAYLCDSTSAPVGSLFPMNGWGALLLALIGVQMAENGLEEESLGLLIGAIPLNFYAWVSLAFLLYIILSDKDFGPMKSAESALMQEKRHEEEQVPSSFIGAMLYPIGFMLLSVPVFLYLSGDGDILKGSGSSAIFYAVLGTLVFMALFYGYTKVMSFEQFLAGARQGAGEMVGIAAILVLAFALGEVTVALKTGPYLASLVEGTLSPQYVATIVFIIAGLISFSTGTSWGTFSIMIPIALPMATVLDASLPLVIAAVVSGGVFGDHCSPISDTTIISSMAAECETISHVRTQLPYAIVSALISLLLFIVFGVLL